MHERVGILTLMVGSLLLMTLSLIKGADDWQNQTIRNYLSDIKKSAEQENGTIGTLNSLVEPVSQGPFIDHQAFGLYYSWLAFTAQDKASLERFSLKSVEQFQLQLAQRPLDSSVVIDKANQMWRNGAEFDAVVAEFHYAQEVGRYEPFTVMQSLKYYLAHWPQLSLTDKKQTISYLLDHKRYKMKLWQYDSILKLPVIGERACNILAFNSVKPYYCRNEN